MNSAVRKALIAIAFVLAVTVFVGLRFGGSMVLPITAGGGTLISEERSTTSQLRIADALMDTPNDEAAEGNHTTANNTSASSPAVMDQVRLRDKQQKGAESEEETLDCKIVNKRFLERYEELAEKNRKERPSDLPDRWVGRNPLCGAYALYNYTGLVLSPSGEGTRRAVVGQTQTFTIETCGSQLFDISRYVSSEFVDLQRDMVCHDVYLVARLHGPSIVAVNVTQLPSPVLGSTNTAATGKDQNSCKFLASYVVHDPGEYWLEVRVVWLDGRGPEKAKARIPITLRKSHTKWGKKPRQRYAYNAECEEQTHIWGSPFRVNVTVPPSNSVTLSTPSSTHQQSTLCNRSNFHGTGRWVINKNERPCAENSTFCEGEPTLLNDVKPFNKDFLWAPLHCRYHFWRHGTGPAKKCTQRSGTLLLMGDSTTREYSQNFKFFDMSLTGLRVSYANWKIEHQWFTKKMAFETVRTLGRELQKSKPVVLAVNLGPLHLIAGLNTTDWQYYVDQWVDVFSKAEQFEFIERKIFLGPSTIHYATNRMTAQRMRLWMDYAEDKLIPLGFEFIDAWQVTAARPESSWDGVHYAAERGKAQMKHMQRAREVKQYKWNGGVSVMLTTILLNILCNP